MYQSNFENQSLEIRAIAEGIFRVRLAPRGKFYTSLLEKYGFLLEPEQDLPATIQENSLQAGACAVTVEKATRTLHFTGLAEAFSVTVPDMEEGGSYRLEFALNPTERLYGLGDNGRDSLNKRGKQLSIWVANVTSYGPIPYLMSSRGWGVLINSTFRQELDLGVTDPNRVTVDIPKGTPDFYVFLGGTMLRTIQLYTDLTGKPVMLPRSGYGLTHVMNQDIDLWNLLRECRTFRQEDIPCDIVGLEPGWMEKYYDFSTDKKWDHQKFPNPTWVPVNSACHVTFFHNLRRMGFKLSLWLCCDYDLLWEEEHTSLMIRRNSYKGAAFEDPWLGYNTLMDKLIKHGEPWFEHLKKFVDNGAMCFKMDGANQVLEHPDRLWAGEYTDAEVHNIYPVIYARQMKQGFENYTGRRAMLYTPSLFVGTQSYAATWAGDTGGGPGSLTSILNLALCGHSNASCDMEQNPAGYHFGFLMPWSQLDNWASWDLPWYLDKATEDCCRRYSKLRSSLIPYIYSMAHKAASQSIPIARPMCLMFPEDEAIAESRNTYMLGDSLLVGAFDMHLRLPAGRWRDLFTGDIYQGGEEFTYQVPQGWGGALFAKEGSVWVSQEPKDYIAQVTDKDYIINIYPGKDAEFDMIEDDGITYKYLQGEYATTHMEICQDAEDSFTFTLAQRTGGYTVDAVEPYRIDSMSENHPSNVSPLPEVTGFAVNVFTQVPLQVSLDGKAVDTSFENGVLSFHITKQQHEAQTLVYTLHP